MVKQLTNVMAVISAMNLNGAIGGGPTWSASVMLLVIGLLAHVLWPLFFGAALIIALYGFISMFRTGDKFLTGLFIFMILVILLACI